MDRKMNGVRQVAWETVTLKEGQERRVMELPGGGNQFTHPAALPASCDYNRKSLITFAKRERGKSLPGALASAAAEMGAEF